MRGQPVHTCVRETVTPQQQNQQQRDNPSKQSACAHLGSIISSFAQRRLARRDGDLVLIATSFLAVREHLRPSRPRYPRDSAAHLLLAAAATALRQHCVICQLRQPALQIATDGHRDASSASSGPGSASTPHFQQQTVTASTPKRVLNTPALSCV